MIGWEDDRVRCQLYRAEVASQLGDATASMASRSMTRPRWILHSGSVEHLCLYHLVRSRIAVRTDDPASAKTAVQEGLHLARRCGLGLYHIELLTVSAELSLRESQPIAAEQAAREALRLAAAPECQFQWGAAQAGKMLAQALRRRAVRWTRKKLDSFAPLEALTTETSLGKAHGSNC